jgi:predicted DNA-binding transcriptional regulator YafY
MARGEQLGRQWNIIQSLLSSRKGKSAAELAEELGCHSRTVYRDLEALQLAGFPIYTERADGRSLWTVLETARQAVPLPLSLTELMALYFSRGLMRMLKGTVFYDSLESLFGKIKKLLPPDALSYLAQIEGSLEVGSGPYKRFENIRDPVEKVSQAIHQKKIIDMVYYTMSRKTESRRRVAPYKLWFVDGSFYVIGNCGLRRDIRIFALDRIKHLELTDESFEIPEDFSLEDFMKASFGVFRGKPVTVRVWFAPEIAGYVRERVWHENQNIISRADGSIIFEAEVAGTEEIKFWVMRWGAKAVVLLPEALREEIREETRRSLENYERGCQPEAGRSG